MTERKVVRGVAGRTEKTDERMTEGFFVKRTVAIRPTLTSFFMEGGVLMAEMPEVLVTGGKGSLGRRVVESLRVADCAVRVLSRSGKEDTVRGNLLTGEGLDEAVHASRL